jgi:putative inorganic carbon (hco3(-)) transporter
MHALLILVPIYVVLFLYFGTSRFKQFLLFTGIVSMPLRTTFTFIGSGAYIGWTNEIMLSISDISFLLLVPSILFKEGFIRNSRRMIMPIALFTGACLLSVLNSTWIRMTIFQVVMLIQCAVLYGLVLYNALETEEDLFFVIKCFSVSLLVQGFFGVAQFVTGRELDYFSTGPGIGELWTLASGSGIRRAVGTVGRANGFAEYVSPLLMIAITMFLWGRKSRLFYGMTCILALLALVFSFSRGGWIGFLPAFIILTFILSKKGIVQIGKVRLVWAAILLVTLIFLPQISERIFGDDANAAGSRIPLIKIAFNMIAEHPITGIGTNTFRSVIRNYMAGIDESTTYLHVVHNQYLLVFAEAGIIGLLSFLWLMYSFFRESIWCVRNENTLPQLIGVATLAGYVAMSVHMLVDMYSSLLANSLMFAFFAVSSAANRISGSTSEHS